MSESPTITYSLKGLDRELWKKVGARLAAEHRTTRMVVVRLLELYADAGLDALSTAAQQQEKR